MRTPKGVMTAACVLAALLAVTSPVRAAMVGEVVFEFVGTLTEDSFTETVSFQPGMVGPFDLRLTDLGAEGALIEPFDALGVQVATPSGVLGFLGEPGTLRFNVENPLPGFVAMTVVGDPSDAGLIKPLGSYGLEVTFVPIPGAAFLLGSALLPLLMLAKRRAGR